MSARVLGVSNGFWGCWCFFLGGVFGFSGGFLGVCWVGVLSGLVWVFDGSFYYFLRFGFYLGQVGVEALVSCILRVY
jgi:hypothetical protein